MSATNKKSIVTWLAAGVAIAILAASSLYLFNRPTPEIPPFDATAMEPRVVERLGEYGDAVKSAPDDARAWARLAQVFHAHELFPQAIAAYAEAMELQPNDSRWPYLAALAQSKLDPQASLALFRRATELKPTNAAVYINFGNVLIRLGQHDEAEQAYRKALEIDPESSHALYGLAQLALVTNELDSAVSLLKRAVTIAPRHGEVYRLLAQAYQRRGDGEEARRQSMLAQAWPDTTRSPDPVAQAMEALAVDSQSIAGRGISLAKRGRYTEAEGAFRDVLAIRAGNARDYANLGGALAGQGRADDALAAYRKGLDIDPADVDTLNNVGYTFLQLQRFDEAERHLQKALEIDPGFAPALGNLGLLAEQQQDFKLAIDYFERALKQNPGLLFARNALASQLARAGDTAAAVNQWRTVLEINPNELPAIHNIAMTQASRGEHAEAIAYLRKGLEIAPNSSRLVAALAWELATSPEDELRNGAEAVQLAQRVYSAFPNQPQMIDIMAAALAESGDFDNAVKLMERLAAASGANAQPFTMRLKAYRQQQAWRQIPSKSVTALVPDR